MRMKAPLLVTTTMATIVLLICLCIPICSSGHSAINNNTFMHKNNNIKHKWNTSHSYGYNMHNISSHKQISDINKDKEHMTRTEKNRPKIRADSIKRHKRVPDDICYNDLKVAESPPTVLTGEKDHCNFNKGAVKKACYAFQENDSENQTVEYGCMSLVDTYGLSGCDPTPTGVKCTPNGKKEEAKGKLCCCQENKCNNQIDFLNYFTTTTTPTTTIPATTSMNATNATDDGNTTTTATKAAQAGTTTESSGKLESWMIALIIIGIVLAIIIPIFTVIICIVTGKGPIGHCFPKEGKDEKEPVKEMDNKPQEKKDQDDIKDQDNKDQDIKDQENMNISQEENITGQDTTEEVPLH